MTDTPPLLRLGTRGSPLALVQAEDARRRLAEAWPELAVKGAITTTVIRTTGDAITDRPLAALGGKGLFTKEIEAALLEGTIDIAVHSMKDVPTMPPAALDIPCVLPREDPRDAVIVNQDRHPDAKSLGDLPPGSVIGTSSLRRAAQIRARFPSLLVSDFRGNVDTRLAKLAAGRADATLLALAGLRRLGKQAVATFFLPPDEMLPAVAQGAVGLQCRDDDWRTRDYLARLNHGPTMLRVTAERALLARLDGSCRTPIAALASARDDALALAALVALPDGSAVHRAHEAVSLTDGDELAGAAALGLSLAETLIDRAGADFFAALETWDQGA